jgi:hypothetical protein
MYRLLSHHHSFSIVKHFVGHDTPFAVKDSFAEYIYDDCPKNKEGQQLAQPKSIGACRDFFFQYSERVCPRKNEEPCCLVFAGLITLACAKLNGQARYA